jgi:hypothetical protein
MRIGDVATKLGVTVSWLRAQERKGRIPMARREALTGRSERRYTEEDVAALRALIFPPPPQPPPVPPGKLIKVLLQRRYSLGAFVCGPGWSEVPESLLPTIR